MFAVLRNRIAHGDTTEFDDDWYFDGHHQISHGEEVLRRAIKRTVVEIVDEPLLEESIRIRAMTRALEEGGYELGPTKIGPANNSQ